MSPLKNADLAFPCIRARNLSATEYAESIVNNMSNLDSLGRQNAGLRIFIGDLRGTFRFLS